MRPTWVPGAWAATTAPPAAPPRRRSALLGQSRTPDQTTGLGCLIPLWCRVALAATDEWAAAVRALVNVGRKPLAESLGLALPSSLEGERAMWALVTELSRLRYHERAAALDAY